MNIKLLWGDSNAEFKILTNSLNETNAYGFTGIDNEENFIYIFGLEFSAICSRFKWYCFLQRSYIGRSYGNKLDPASSCKYHFIFDIAFNILWDALAPLWEKNLFEAGSQSGRRW